MKNKIRGMPPIEFLIRCIKSSNSIFYSIEKQYLILFFPIRWHYNKLILKHQQNKHFNQANKVHIKMNLFETTDERVTEFRDIP